MNIKQVDLVCVMEKTMNIKQVDLVCVMEKTMIELHPFVQILRQQCPGF